MKNNNRHLPLRQALGFTIEPFDKHLNAKHLFSSRQIKELFNKLKQLIYRRGIALITGEIGCGKSTVIRAFIESMDKKLYHIAYIADPTIGSLGMLNEIATQINLETSFFKWQLMTQLKNAIEKDFHDFNKPTLLIIDEVHLMNTKTLEELRLFTNFNFDSQSPLNLILIAQPEVTQKIRLSSLQALSQRINFRFHLTGLDRSEAKEYIIHQLKIAGRTDNLFSDDVIEEIFQQSKGIPRVINNICYACLLEIYQQNKNVVDTQTLENVILQWDI